MIATRMDKERLKGVIIEVLIAIAVALVGCIPFAYLMMYGSALLFDKLYPHDGQNGLGVLFVGILALPGGFVVFFVATMAVRRYLQMRRRRNQSQLEAESTFTITGLPME
jgi:ABC-type enterochelin transport system permease subunit